MSWGDLLTPKEPVHIFAENNYLGAGVQWQASRRTLRSWFNYCPKCGEVWAKGFVESAEDWEARCIPCRHHKGGSLIMSEPIWKIEWPLTKEFMMYELELYLENPEEYKNRPSLFRAC